MLTAYLVLADAAGPEVPPLPAPINARSAWRLMSRYRLWLKEDKAWDEGRLEEEARAFGQPGPVLAAVFCWWARSESQGLVAEDSKGEVENQVSGSACDFRLWLTSASQEPRPGCPSPQPRPSAEVRNGRLVWCLRLC